MSTFTRPHATHRHISVEPSRRGVTLCLPNRKGMARLEFTRQQARTLEQRLHDAVGRAEHEPAPVRSCGAGVLPAVARASCPRYFAPSAKAGSDPANARI